MHFSLKPPRNVRMRAGGRKSLREHQLIFMSESEDEEIFMSDVSYAAAKQQQYNIKKRFLLLLESPGCESRLILPCVIFVVRRIQNVSCAKQSLCYLNSNMIFT
jgi:hypothetical protein